MKVNGKSKTPITAAQSKRNTGESGGTKARTSKQPSRKKLNGVKTAVLDRISDGILAFDAGMNYTYLNERAGELLGRSVEELIGKNLEDEYSGAGRDASAVGKACGIPRKFLQSVFLAEFIDCFNRRNINSAIFKLLIIIGIYLVKNRFENLLDLIEPFNLEILELF